MTAKLNLHAKLDEAVAKGLKLREQPVIPLSARKCLPQVPAVYVFFDRARAVHVGRCRRLRDRVNGQCSGSFYSSSFAFKETRRRIADRHNDQTYLTATYQTKGSRKELFARPYFRAEFDAVIEWLRDLQLRFLVTADDVEQYLLELVVANEVGVSMDEFRTT